MEKKSSKKFIKVGIQLDFLCNFLYFHSDKPRASTFKTELSYMGVIVPFETIPEMFQRVTDRFGTSERPFLMYKAGGKYQGVSFAEVRRQVELFAHGLAALGVQRGDRIGIIAENRPEWVVADMGTLFAGAFDVPVYTTLTPAQIEYIFNNARVKVAIVSNQAQLAKILKVRDRITSLKYLIIMGKQVEAPNEKVLDFGQVYDLGEGFRGKNPNYLNGSLAKIRPEDLCTVIYTSGTTGNPKGVMLTHHNFATNIVAAADVIPFNHQDVLLSYLPLCHSFERMAGYYTATACGATIAYAESIETIRENLLEVRPTIVTSVPRLFERLHGRILKQADASPSLRRKIFYWAVSVGRRFAFARKSGAPNSLLRLKHWLASKLVFNKLKARVGGRIRFFVSGGAALAREFGEFFEAFDIKIIEGYGLTETSPVISVNPVDDYKFGTVGKPIPGIEVRIADDGEILTRGPHVMKGYWEDPSSTREVISKDGWLHTGDIGHIDSDGYLVITDRKKHLFVSSGGKNIAPQPIENLFLKNKYIDQFVLIGDRRMFLTALIVPDFEALRQYALTERIAFTDESDLVKKEQVLKFMEKNIQELQRDLAHFERVRKFVLLDKPLTIESGEMTPTQKVRRKAVEQHYASAIERMYSGLS